MFTLTLPSFRKAGFPDLRSPTAVRPRRTPAGVIWSLHRVIADPEATASEVRTAKRLLLRALADTGGLPHMTAPPIGVNSTEETRSAIQPRALRAASTTKRRSRNAARVSADSSMQSRRPVPSRSPERHNARIRSGPCETGNRRDGIARALKGLGSL